MSSGPGPGSLRPHCQVGSAARVRSEVVLGGRPQGHESVPEQVGASPGLPKASPMGWETLLRDGGVLDGHLGECKGGGWKEGWIGEVKTGD